MSRVDELRGDQGRPPTTSLTVMDRFDTASDADQRDASPARSNRQLLQGSAAGDGSGQTAAESAPKSRPSHSRPMRSRSDAPDPNLVEFGVRDPDNPMNFSTLKKLRIFIVRLAVHCLGSSCRSCCCISWLPYRSGPSMHQQRPRSQRSSASAASSVGCRWPCICSRSPWAQSFSYA